MNREQFFAEARVDRAGPIDGLRVLECTTTWAGPMAGCVLADLGADVIKVEQPEGEISRTMEPFLPGTKLSFAHETVNRNKRCLTLDLRTDEGRDLFLEVAATADVVLENFRPGTLAGWGVGYEHVREIKPDIVYVSISGWGQYGPWSQRVGYDPLVQAASGMMAINGHPDHRNPSRTPTWLADDLAGVHAGLGALAALRHRDATGEGQHVDISMLDAALFQSNGYLTLGAIDYPLEPWGSALQFCVPGNAYACADGRHVYTGAILNSHWARICELLGRPELAEAEGFADNSQRIANREVVDGLMAAWCASQESADVVATLEAKGLAVTYVNEYSDIAREPYVSEREMLVDVKMSDGVTAPLTAPAAKFSRTPTSIRFPAPALGEHTREVLAEVGVSDERYEQLRLDSVI
ncbi:MAG: CaiB/BaiF CoA-transferase family protein [Actinomycetota bacterium]|nr:CaiB/BaiF CoA-transferase family protein [Actinomycetota bacterium]